MGVSMTYRDTFERVEHAFEYELGVSTATAGDLVLGELCDQKLLIGEKIERVEVMPVTNDFREYSITISSTVIRLDGTLSASLSPAMRVLTGNSKIPVDTVVNSRVLWRDRIGGYHCSRTATGFNAAQLEGYDQDYDFFAHNPTASPLEPWAPGLVQVTLSNRSMDLRSEPEHTAILGQIEGIAPSLGHLAAARRAHEPAFTRQNQREFEDQIAWTLKETEFAQR